MIVAAIEDACWAAVLARDPAADGRFVYAVTTTGVYCRPACTARRPHRRNVRFFDTPSEAQAAGFRACRRCHPQQGAQSAETSLMQAMAAHIYRHADQPLPLARLAAEADMSPGHFQRRFTAVMGVSPRAWQAAARLKLFKARLAAGDAVLPSMLEAGYGSTSRVQAQTDGGLGMTPSAYRAGGKGEVIGYAVRETPLGLLLMAATARGVCAVLFGDDRETLEAELRQEFPRARLQPTGAEADAALEAWMAALAAHLQEVAPAPDLPLDLRGTAFQIRVWRFLMSIPPGAVVSYAELSKGIGAPRAVRAAARACAANSIAVLVPCHRVLRADGGLGGYRWGAPRKRALLDAERRAPA
jgi:AraC family transcriptional regulator of adaptative response/methylated-DNA-[protein]-cysteine methyltransferase